MNDKATRGGMRKISSEPSNCTLYAANGSSRLERTLLFNRAQRWWRWPCNSLAPILPQVLQCNAIISTRCHIFKSSFTQKKTIVTLQQQTTTKGKSAYHYFSTTVILSIETIMRKKNYTKLVIGKRIGKTKYRIYREGQ